MIIWLLSDIGKAVSSLGSFCSCMAGCFTLINSFWQEHCRASGVP